MRVFLVIEERKKIMQEVRKNVPSDMGAPSIGQAVVNSGLSLTRPDWNFNMKIRSS